MFKESNKFEKFESKVWLSSPTMHGPEIEYVKEAYETNWMSNIVCCFPFWKEDFVKKLQSCAGKVDMFVERSRNKSIDKKSALCYSESTNYIQSVWTSRFSRGKNTS